MKTDLPLSTAAKRPLVVRILREPLLHFVLLAAGLFAVAAFFRPGDDVIEVSREELDWRIFQVEAEAAAPLSAEERRRVEDAYIDERVLIREARALGLEADTRIDDILVQKMLHVLSADVIQPTDDELAAYYEANLESYTTAPAISVDEIVLPSGAPLPRELLDGGSPDEVPRDALIDHRFMSNLREADLAPLFGQEAAARTLAADLGVWVDAVESARGHHWLRVRTRIEPSIQPLSVVREKVRLDWIAAQEQVRLSQRVAELRSRYTVVVEDGPGGP